MAQFAQEPEATRTNDVENDFTAKIRKFPRHEVIKLNKENFVSWRHQVNLILEGYGLTGLALGTSSIPARYSPDSTGELTDNHEYIRHVQQDKLLASWLLSTISPEILPYLTGASTTSAIWNILTRRYAAKSNAKIASLKHVLHSQKKGSLSISEYLVKIQNLCDTLTASGAAISEDEQTSIILAGLSSEFESVIVSASRQAMTLEVLTELLEDCEARQQSSIVDSTSETPMLANMMENLHVRNEQPRHPSSSRGRGYYRGRGRGRYNHSNKIQCQLCGKLGHLVNRCWHRFDEHFSGSAAAHENQFGDKKEVNYHGVGYPNNHTTSVQSHHMPHAQPTRMPNPWGYIGNPPGFSPYNHSVVGSSYGGSSLYANETNPSQYAGPASADRSVNPNMTSLLTVAGNSKGKETAWYPDSGATNHVTHDISEMANQAAYSAFVEGGIQDANDDSCSICLEEFSSSDPSTVTNCKHEFHLQCILEWCQRSSQCPMCWQAIRLKDPLSQELLQGVERERTVRDIAPRNNAIFHHPTLGDFELQHLPVGVNHSELEERIIQHLAAAAAMRRTRHNGRREGWRRSSARSHPNVMVFSPNAQHSGSGSSTQTQIVGESEAPVINVARPSSPLTSWDEMSQFSSSLNTSASGSTVSPLNRRGFSFNNRSTSSDSSLTNQEEAGPSEFQSFSDSVKSRLNSVSLRYKETISKSTRGWKERLFSCNSSMSDIGNEVRREVSAGIASVSGMMQGLEINGNNRENQASASPSHLAESSSTEQGSQHNTGTNGDNPLRVTPSRPPHAASSLST